VSATNATRRFDRSRHSNRIFVGNRCLEDNIAECVKVAIYNAIGEAAHGVTVTVQRGVARLDGVVDHAAKRGAAAAAAITQPGIEAVDDRLSVVEPLRLCQPANPLTPVGSALTTRTSSTPHKSGDPR
jgi:osmotically-inducible protein OsmY